MFSKLYSLVYVYVHFRIQSTAKEAFITNVVKTILGKLAIAHLIICSIFTECNGMLSKCKWIIIEIY
jgi:hypothetical protein